MLAQRTESTSTGCDAGVFAGVRTYDLAILPEGAPVMTYFAYSDEPPIRGPDGFDRRPVDLRIAACTSGTCTGD